MEKATRTEPLVGRTGRPFSAAPSWTRPTNQLFYVLRHLSGTNRCEK